MSRLRRVSNLPLATLSVFFASVFFLGATVYAQSPIRVRPLSVNEQMILQRSQSLDEKSSALENTSLELQSLEEKRSSLAGQLEAEEKKITELRQKIAEKKAAEERARAQAAQARTASAPTASTPAISGGGLRSGCGDNQYAAYIYGKESGGTVPGMCNTTATNAGGCFGIGQACPGSKVAHCGADYACQNAWFTNYAMGRYGSWAAAYNFHRNNNWW